MTVKPQPQAVCLLAVARVCTGWQGARVPGQRRHPRFWHPSALPGVGASPGRRRWWARPNSGQQLAV